ncbi:MAG: L-threonylcarbamoyladenylate synthase [Sulfolobales archaeon]|nr:L-threonylcarbamoyladenylate synthase [Sulfolobales archaeon]MCX8208776.1 L-threonylcarbamoyladenylate synthase [Sulfolobales archaeon]MDW8010274.1 L-threonylcarbamoyladenylate synthase [Sulfolobales archaeon]
MPRARVVRVDPIRPSEEVLEEAAGVLRSGGLVAFPTETVYGLGADAFNSEAVLKVFRVKRRPLDNPLIVHVSSLDMLHQVAVDVPDWVVRALSNAWPGPLTVVLKRRADLPAVVSGGLGTVAVRCPAHPVALKLIEALGRPVAAPSANLAGRPSPTRAEHVVEDLGDEIDLIIDAGETFFGVESTVVDLVSPRPQILRPGPVGPEELEKVFGFQFYLTPLTRGFSTYIETPPSPGMKYRHYAPSKKLVLVEKGSCGFSSYLDFLIDLLRSYSAESPALLATRETIDEIGMKLGADIAYIALGSRENLFEVAKNLYSSLRSLDKLDKISIAFSESIEEKGLGLAIMNRLRKASSERLVCK